MTIILQTIILNRSFKPERTFSYILDIEKHLNLQQNQTDQQLESYDFFGHFVKVPLGSSQVDAVVVACTRLPFNTQNKSESLASESLVSDQGGYNQNTVSNITCHDTTFDPVKCKPIISISAYQVLTRQIYDLACQIARDEFIPLAKVLSHCLPKYSPSVESALLDIMPKATHDDLKSPHFTLNEQSKSDLRLKKQSNLESDGRSDIQSDMYPSSTTLSDQSVLTDTTYQNPNIFYHLPTPGTCRIAGFTVASFLEDIFDLTLDGKKTLIILPLASQVKMLASLYELEGFEQCSFETIKRYFSAQNSAQNSTQNSTQNDGTPAIKPPLTFATYTSGQKHTNFYANHLFLEHNKIVIGNKMALLAPFTPERIIIVDESASTYIDRSSANFDLATAVLAKHKLLKNLPELIFCSFCPSYIIGNQIKQNKIAITPDLSDLSKQQTMQDPTDFSLSFSLISPPADIDGEPRRFSSWLIDILHNRHDKNDDKILFVEPYNKSLLNDFKTITANFKDKADICSLSNPSPNLNIYTAVVFFDIDHLDSLNKPDLTPRIINQVLGILSCVNNARDIYFTRSNRFLPLIRQWNPFLALNPELEEREALQLAPFMHSYLITAQKNVLEQIIAQVSPLAEQILGPTPIDDESDALSLFDDFSHYQAIVKIPTVKRTVLSDILQKQSGEFTIERHR